MARKKNPIDLRKLSKDSNPRLAELLAEIAENSSPSDTLASTKPTWGRRFSASGKSKVVIAPKIRRSYQE